MSVRVMAAVFDRSEATANDRLVLLAIADEADDDGTNAYPGLERIAHKVRLPKRTVRRCVERLETLGELEVSRPERQGRGHVNHYSILVRTEGGQSVPLPAALEKGHKGAQRGAALPNPSQTLRPLDSESKSKDAEEVFRTWKQSTSRGGQTVLDDKRSRLILKALKDYPLPDVLDAVRGWERSAYHQGSNEAGKVYNDLSLLLRDAEHIERFRDLYRGGGTKPAPKVRVDADGVPLDPNSHEALFGVRPPVDSNGHGG